MKPGASDADAGMPAVPVIHALELAPASIRPDKVEEALQAGEEGDLEPFRNLLLGLEKPYEDGEHLAPYQIPPKPEEKVTETFCGT